MIKNNNYLTSKEAAKELGFSTDHVRNLIRKNKIIAKKFGTQWLIDKKNLTGVVRKRFKKSINHEE